MEQERLFLVIVIIFLMFSHGPCAEAGDRAVADATLTAYELQAAPADQPLDQQPRWQSSLGEIQQAAATLLETNAKLKTESRQLKSDLDAVQAQIDEQRVKKAQVSDKLSEGHGKAQENSDQAQILRLKEVLADRGQQVQAQKEMLGAFKARRGSLDSRVALARLRVAGLEVDQKSRSVEEKFQDETAMNALRAESQSLRDKISKGELQAKLLAEKTDELNRLDNPYIPQTRELSAKNAELRKRLNDLKETRNAKQLQFELVAASKLKAEQDHNVLYVQKLLSERDALQTRLKENEEKLAALKSGSGQGLTLPGMSPAAMDKLQQQNAVMEELVGNLRENIALLEYKVTSLQRYKDRNKPVPQNK